MIVTGGITAFDRSRVTHQSRGSVATNLRMRRASRDAKGWALKITNDFEANEIWGAGGGYRERRRGCNLGATGGGLRCSAGPECTLHHGARERHAGTKELRPGRVGVPGSGRREARFI